MNANRAAPATRLEINRRAALKLFTGGVLASVAGCSRAAEKNLPYVDMPEGLVAGEPQYYATVLPLGGFGRGVIVKAIDGRPIKIAGNPRHPASLGATDLFAEAALMELYDPERSSAVRGARPITGWTEFLGELQRWSSKAERGEAPLNILTSTVASPTLLRQIASLKTDRPGTRWFAYDPRGETDGTHTLIPRFDRASVIVCLDADPLGPGPMQAMLSRAFAEGRKPGSANSMSRLYVIESTWTLTGANADHRIALPPDRIEAVAWEIAGRLEGRAGPSAALGRRARRFVDEMIADLQCAGTGGLLLPGPTLGAANVQTVLQAGKRFGVPLGRAAGLPAQSSPESLADFGEALQSGKIENVLFLDCNPAFDAFPDAAFAKALKNLPFAVHAGVYENETANLCRWHLPLSHPLESWSDLAAADGTMAIAQPLIRPLYDTRSSHEILAFYSGRTAPSGYDIVRQTWERDDQDTGFEEWWRDALVKGVVAGRSPPFALIGAMQRSESPPSPEPEVPVGVGMFVAVIRPDPTIFDGRFTNNAWLQECPKPLSKNTWTNAISLAPEDAAELNASDGDVLAVTSTMGTVEGPLRIDKGQARRVVGLTLGYGRTAAGAIGNGLGYNPRVLSPGNLRNIVGGIRVRKTDRRAPIPSTQMHFNLDGDLAELMPEVSPGQPLRLSNESEAPKPSFFEPPPGRDPYSWAMVIDAAACTGCNACVVACQSENNVAVVGPDEVANGRAMHWLRIDTYDIGTPEEPRHGFEPVPCMQCEKAPCEPVCPVEASVHDTEGLNVQVYNRCVGTRFCQSNCPYKVRRFNWFAYNSGQEYKDLGEDPMPARNNPDVTIRARGVMEKCTYCVQRISRARRQAEKTDRPIADGVVRTACQEACPTRAISFGNLQDNGSRVNALCADPRHFALLEELGTRPRTTYLARVRNANPKLAGGDA
jgi:molybdopterin-containing oxidoreductase family iron-sulfur binding subunit